MKVTIFAWAVLAAAVFAQAPENTFEIGTPEWNAERQKCFNHLEREFRPWMATAQGLNRFRNMIADYDAIAKERDPAMYANPWKALYFARMEKVFLAKEAAEDAAAKNRSLQSGDNFEQFVTNSVARAAIDHTEKETAEPIPPTIIPAVILKPREIVLEGGQYFRRGDRITSNGDASTGYQIKGNMLISVKTGTPTHMRSGHMWMPLLPSEQQIQDSER